MTPQSIMIFAAGLGTRMGALTKDRPKPLIEVAGKPLIDHAIDLTTGLGLRRRVVNTHYHAAMLQRHLAGQDILISDETDLLLETGGGLRHALPLLGPDPVFTLNSDAVWGGHNPLRTLAAAWDPDRMEALLLLLPPQSALGHRGAGDFFLGTDDRLIRGPGLIYGGAQIMRTDRLADIPDPVFSLNRVWDQMAQDGGLFGVRHDGRWCDVGRPDSIALAETMLADADV